MYYNVPEGLGLRKEAGIAHAVGTLGKTLFPGIKRGFSTGARGLGKLSEHLSRIPNRTLNRFLAPQLQRRQP